RGVICVSAIRNPFMQAPRPSSWSARPSTAATEAGMVKPALARPLPGFENIRRYTNLHGQVICKLLPGDFYVTTHDEVLDTVLGSCVSACIRNPKLGIGGMNHFMLARPSGNGNDAWETGAAGRATRYGSAS